VFDQITDFVTQKNIIDSCQSGFRKLHSTGTALLRIVEYFRLAMGRGEVTVLVLFDFSKAFESVLHTVLLSKLKHMNFSNSTIKWIEQYLHNRTHCVVGPHASSEWRNIMCGVPQCSVLGPLVYSLFSYDIGKCFINCKYHLYADDLQIYIYCKPSEINQIISLINSEIICLVNWTNKHGLTSNASKTQAILIHKSGVNVNLNGIDKIVVNDVPIEYSNKVKNLGLIIDDKLTWDPQVSSVCQKCYFTLHRLYKFRAYTPIETRKRLVTTLISLCLIIVYLCVAI
jgi:hypothetical protein